MFLTAYYGMFRVGELTQSPHTVAVTDVHEAQNKTKMLFILHTSKTHSRADFPQKVYISRIKKSKQCYCPVEEIKSFIKMRRGYIMEEEPFFIHQNGDPVQPNEFRTMLKKIIKNFEPRP